MTMNADLVKKALAVAPNPNLLVNLASRRVHQLNAGLGSEIPAEEKARLAPGGQSGMDY